jgi:sec-independent protein translocase protein TatA
MSLGPWEIGLIVILVLIVFGAGKLPQIGDMIGKTIRNIRKATSDPLGEEDKRQGEDSDRKGTISSELK